MPNKTIYVSDDDLALFARAQDVVWGDGGSVSPLRDVYHAGWVIPRRPDDHRMGV